MTKEAIRAWRFPDNVDTDAIIPARHLTNPDPKSWARGIFEHTRPEFASQVAPDDCIVAGRSFGSGSSREHAAIALREAGITTVIAESFARNFYRNGFNNGLLLLEAVDPLTVEDGDKLVLHIEASRIENLSQESWFHIREIPLFLIDMHHHGGLVPWLNTRGRTFDMSEK